MNEFERFYKTEVLIERPAEAGSYSKPTQYQPVCVILADIQPNSSGGSRKEYGLFTDIRFLLYCARNPEIEAGMCAQINGKRFMIAGVEQRDLGTKAYLKEGV